MNKPAKDDSFQCKECGMEIKVTKDCKCEKHEPKLECYGKALTKV